MEPVFRNRKHKKFEKDKPITRLDIKKAQARKRKDPMNYLYDFDGGFIGGVKDIGCAKPEMGWIMPESVDKAAIDISTFISKFDTLDVTNVSNLLNAFTTAPENGKSLLEKSLDVPDTIDNVLNSTREIFKDMKSFGFGGAITVGMGAIAYAVANEENRIKSFSVASLAFLVAYMLAPATLPSSRQPFLELVGLCKANEPKPNVAQPQSEMLSLNGIAQTLTMGLFGVGAIKNKKGIIESITSYLNNAKRQQITIVEHISSAAQFMQGLMNKVLAVFYKEDYKFMNVVSSTIPKLDAIQGEIREFCHKMDRKEIPMTIEYYDIVLSYENRLDLLLTELGQSKNVEYAKGVITSLQNTVRKLLEAFASSNFMNAGIRQEPVAILLKGPPGVGKTAILTRLHMALCARTLPEEELVEFRRNPMSFMHCRQMENEFWDGYTPRVHTVNFDDMNQIKDIAGKPDNEFFNLIRGINLFPYLLHMAGLNQKSNTFFKAKFVLATTNANIFNIESINCKEAILRRFDYCIRIIPLIQYTKSVPSSVSRIIDSEKLPIVDGKRTLTPECVNLHFCNAEGPGLMKRISFDNLVDLLVKKFFAKKAHAEQLLNEYQKVIDNQIESRTQSEEEIELLNNREDMRKALQDDGNFCWEQESIHSNATTTTEFGEAVPQASTADEECRELLEEIQETTKMSPIMTRIEPELRVPIPSYDPYEEDLDVPDVDMDSIDYSIKEFAISNTQRRRELEDQLLLNGSAFRILNPSSGFLKDQMRDFLKSDCMNYDQKAILAYLANKLMDYGIPIEEINYAECINLWMLATKMERFSDLISMTYEHFLSVFNEFEFEGGMEQWTKKSYFSKAMEYIKPVMQTKWFIKMKAIGGEIMNGIYWLLLNISRFLSNPIVKIAIAACVTYFGIGKLFGMMCGKSRKSNEDPMDGWITQSRDESAKGKQGARKHDIRNLLARKAVNSQHMPQMGASYDKSSQDVIDKAVNRNCYTFSISNQSGNYTHLGFATFVVGRIYIVPMHFATYIANQVIDDENAYRRKVKLTKSVNRPGTNFAVIEFTFREFLEWGIHAPKYENNDVFFGTISKSYPNHCDIRSKFLTEKQYVPGKDWTTSITCPFADRTSTCIVQTFMLKNPYDVANIVPGLPNTVLSRGLCYRKSITAEGHCGALVSNLNKNPSIGTIVGIHVAGIKSINSGLSNFISREMLMDVTEDVDTQFRELESIDPQVAYAEMGSTLSFPTEEKEVAEIPCRFPIVGKIDKAMNRASFTNIVPSCLHKQLITKPTTAPAKLRPFERDGEIVDPYALALEKYGLGWTYVPEKLVEQAAECYYEDLCTVSTENVEARLLTYDEAVLGVEDESLYTSIKRNTSAGYPINADKSFVGKKKFGIFGEDEKYDLNTPDAQRVKKRVYIVIDAARKNIRLDHIFHDNIKDERRDILKALYGYSRLFSGCPLDYLIAFRIYFGTFFLWYQKNRIFNGSGIGVNPFSEEWHLIAELLREKAGKGKGYFAGDFKGYDGSLLTIILYAVLQVIQMWYNDGEENARVRRILWLEVINSKHLWNIIIYMFLNGIPSGHPGTSYINTIYQQISFRIVWCIILGDSSRDIMKQFTKFVFLVCYGDDNVMGVHPDVRDKFNPQAMSEAFKYINLTYTDDKKQVVTELKTFDEVSFLKRSFIYNQVDQKYRGPLQLKVILEVPLWTVRKGDQRESVTKTNVQWALDELSLWGRPIFNQYAPDMLEQCRQVMNWSPERMLFNSCYSFCCGKEEFF